jgi:hypothetical protein
MYLITIYSFFYLIAFEEIHVIYFTVYDEFTVLDMNTKYFISVVFSITFSINSGPFSLATEMMTN